MMEFVKKFHGYLFYKKLKIKQKDKNFLNNFSKTIFIFLQKPKNKTKKLKNFF